MLVTIIVRLEYPPLIGTFPNARLPNTPILAIFVMVAVTGLVEKAERPFV